MTQNIKIFGKEGITVTVLADSVSSVAENLRMTTYEIELPRFIWAECLTHRLFSRNAASSRAIPVLKKIKQVWSNPSTFVYWGRNKPGMKATEEIDGLSLKLGKFLWKFAGKIACVFAYALSKLGFHKQISNRILEPWERLKVVLSGTEFENWFWLRDHEDAQPEIREVARLMWEARLRSTPLKLKPGEWHLPYVTSIRANDDQMLYLVDNVPVDVETAKRVSVSSCAQVSYRILNQSIDKAEDIYKRLVTAFPCHFSPLEHQATPMQNPYPVQEEDYYEVGATHYSFELSSVWSGNFQGWIQNRQLIQRELGLNSMIVK